MTRDPRIDEVLARMEDSLDQPLSLPALARSVNLSVSRLAHLFTREVGVSPARHLRDLRMRRARVLLEGTVLNVKQAMMCVGVTDPSHFSRDFRRYHGVPPSRIRQRSVAADRGRRVPHRDAAGGPE